MRRWLLPLFFLSAVGLAAPASALSAQTAPPPAKPAPPSLTSTPEERAHWPVALHELERYPLDNTPNENAENAVHRIMDVKDFHVALCQAYFAEFSASKYKHHDEVLRLYMLGAASGQVEAVANPNLAAIESVLRGYAAILSVRPEDKDKQLDHLAKLEREGKLPDAVHKSCK